VDLSDRNDIALSLVPRFLPPITVGSPVIKVWAIGRLTSDREFVFATKPSYLLIINASIAMAYHDPVLSQKYPRKRRWELGQSLPSLEQ